MSKKGKIARDILNGNAPASNKKFAMETGKGGAILYLRWLHEVAGREWTNEDQRQAEENYAEGAYLINNEGIHYKGFHVDEEDGFWVFRDGKGKYERWYVKDKWVSADSIQQITEAEYNSVLPKSRIKVL